MMHLVLLLAATLSSGNAEFEKTASMGAFEITLGREKARLVAEGPEKGSLTRAMLARPEAFAKAEDAKAASWAVYRAGVDAEFVKMAQAAGSRLGVTNGVERIVLTEGELAKAKEKFEARYQDERVAACNEQATSLVGSVRPSVVEFETKDEATLKREMSEKVAAQQKTAVFEENLPYISSKIVEPVLDAAKKERKRQGEYLRRAKSDCQAPSKLADDLRDKLVLNVKDRMSSAADLEAGWDVFPSVTNTTLPNVVHKRIMERFAAKVAEVPFEIKKNEIAKTIAEKPLLHRPAKASCDIFRRAWTLGLGAQAATALREDASEGERDELGQYLTTHASDEVVAKAIGKRVEDDFMPQYTLVRDEIARAEYEKTWPTLSDRTWWPDAETADETSARSDFAAAVKRWRDMPKVDLPKGDEVLEEASSMADKSVAAAFELARGAVASQTRIVDEVHPAVLGEAKEKRDSFWSKTPDLAKVIAMLTEAVEKRWAETKIATLWPQGDLPANAAIQHAELFPSVKKRIELVAKAIMDEIKPPEPEEEQPEEPLVMYSIVVSRQGDCVTVKLDQGGKTLFDKSPKAQMGEFRGAMNEVGEKLGKEILLLK